MAIFVVTGMTCAHCVRAVTDAVHEIDPAAEVAIDLGSGRVAITGSQAEPAALTAAIENEGYEAALIPG